MERTDESEEVGDVRSGETQVGNGNMFPLRTEISTVTSNDVERGTVGGIISSGSDNHVDLAARAILSDDGIAIHLHCSCKMR